MNDRLDRPSFRPEMNRNAWFAVAVWVGLGMLFVAFIVVTNSIPHRD